MYRNKKIKIKKFNHKQEKRRKHIFRYIILGVLISGILFQQLGSYYTASSLGRVGRVVSVKDVDMHIYEAGELGEKTPIVFSSNIGTASPYVESYPLHSNLSMSHPVSVYDKPGYGWSDITSEARDIDIICEEIHTVLHSNEIPDDEDTFIEPFIFVGYGMGSLEVIRYAQLYPEDVAGIVLIEGASPQFCVDFNNIMIMESFMTNALRNFGVLRLLSGTSFIANVLGQYDSNYPKEILYLNKGLALDKVWNRNILSEKLKVPDNGQVVLDGGSLNDIPLRVITSESNIYTNWSRTQRSLLTLSTDSSQTFIEGSTSYIEYSDTPQILEVIDALDVSIRGLND